jgi:hypothetical protein
MPNVVFFAQIGVQAVRVVRILTNGAAIEFVAEPVRISRQHFLRWPAGW